MTWRMWLVGTLFFLSGGTALIYQILWMRQLSLFFGSDVYAAAITLSVFMSGLSFGAYLSGRISDRTDRPLLFYGVLEIGVAICAIAFPLIISSFEDVSRSIYQGDFATHPLKYHFFRLVISVGALLLPTVLMGATLPLLIRRFAHKKGELGKRVAFFYAANTLGAFTGTLLAGFVLLQTLGIQTTNYVNLIVNLAIGAVAILLGLIRFNNGNVEKLVVISDSYGSEKHRIDVGENDKIIVVVAIAISGLAALSLEVVWTRILVQSFSGTVHSFAVMLACFLFGIFFGSRKAAETADDLQNPAMRLYILELWLAGTVAVLIPVTYLVPSVFAELTWSLTGLTGGSFAAGSILAQFVIAGMLIFIPTALLGATFPIAVKAYTGSIQHRAHGTGIIYAANTAGAVLGALLGGFILLPTFGGRASLAAVAMLFLVAATVLRRSAQKHSGGLAGVHKLVPVILLIGGTSSLALIPQQIVVNYNMQKSTTPEVIYHGDGVAHTVDLVRSGQGHTIMMINGNIEADTTYVQRRHFMLKGHLPLLLHGQAKDVAIVGLGLGITARTIMNNPSVERVQLIELSPEMVQAHRLNPEVSGHVLENPKLDLRIDDGRNFMHMSGQQFDMITADPIHPRITGVGYLYTQQYYQMIKKRLRPGGVALQWVPLYRISKHSFDVALRTFLNVFPKASFWYVRGHGLFVSGKDDLAADYHQLVEQFSQTPIGKDLESIDINSPEELLSHLLMDAEHIRAYLAAGDGEIVNTDDNAFLEYHTPFEFLEGPKPIVSGLVSYAGWDMDSLFRNMPADTRDRVRELFKQRINRLIPELEERIE